MSTMRIRTHSVTTLLAAATFAVAIAAAPAAAADPGGPQVACNSGAPDSSCVSPGNAQINDSLPPDFTPQYPAFSLFGFGGHSDGHGEHR
jgi:hypothetical protein